MIFTSTIPDNLKAGKELSTYLSERFTYFSRDKWLEKIREKKVTINGVIACECDTALPGAQISYDAGEFEEPPANLNYKIIYEDKWLLGIDKPGNLLVHRAGKSFRNNLIYQLRAVHDPKYVNAQSVHRLDRDTSGVVLIAKTSEACSVMGNLFVKNMVEKEYLAIVKGIPEFQKSEISIPIGKDRSSLIGYKYRPDPAGKFSVTMVEEITPIGKTHALMRMRPLTGRTHQIRIHCAATGHPIIGDKLYTMSESQYIKWRENPQEYGGIDFPRHALHCKSISFKHPYMNTLCTITADLPDDLSNLISELKGE